MPDTFVKIATVTVGSGGAANIDFSSIPQTYTDLNLVISGRGVHSANFVGIQLGINGGFPTANFRNVFGNSSTASSTSGSDVFAGSMVAANATASTFGNVSIYFPNYAGSTNKSYSVDSVTENNASAANSVYTSLWAGLISSTAAISRITIYDGSAGANIAQYSTATLYGISKS
jgi:hypothetical protein